MQPELRVNQSMPNLSPLLKGDLSKSVFSSMLPLKTLEKQLGHLENNTEDSFREDKKEASLNTRKSRRLQEILSAIEKSRLGSKVMVDPEELAHQYHSLKRNFNKLKVENTKWRTSYTLLH